MAHHKFLIVAFLVALSSGANALTLKEDVDDVDPCQHDPCLNGGSCEVRAQRPKGFLCRCPKGWSGDTCEVHNDDAARRREHIAMKYRNLQRDGVAHTLDDGKVVYHLQEDVLAARTDYHPCENKELCENGGRCLAMEGEKRWRCECGSGYGGKRCQWADGPGMGGKWPCLNEICQHGGSCEVDFSSAVGFKCQCQSGFRGFRCEHDIHAEAKSAGVHGRQGEVQEDMDMGDPDIDADLEMEEDFEEHEHFEHDMPDEDRHDIEFPTDKDHPRPPPRPSAHRREPLRESMARRDEHLRQVQSKRGRQADGQSTVQYQSACKTSDPCLNGLCVDTDVAPMYACHCNTGWKGQHCDTKDDDL